MSRRTERVASAVQQELALMIQSELNDPRLAGMPSITRVKISPDLSVADVYVTVMGTDGQQAAALAALRHAAGWMRPRLTRSLSLRAAPILKFHLDENLKKELAVLDLLKKIEIENAGREQDSAGGETEVDGSGPGSPEVEGEHT